MFKNLMQFWKGKDFLQEVLEEFKAMLNQSETMFNAVCKKLLQGEGEAKLEDNIYSLDKKVNQQERDIRKRVVEHLIIQPAVDVPVSLLLMSVVKDAERLGDYCKNLLEVDNLLEKTIEKSQYSEFFDVLEQEVAELFKKTREAFMDSDEDKATESWNMEREIVKRCDEIIARLAKSNISVNEAVCFTLMARYFKRIVAHLTNIATSVIVPVSDLDYYDEKRKK